jgi:GNAT superfamily N-acetyltransferase
MARSALAITDFRTDPQRGAVLEFLEAWVSGDRAGAEQHVADHTNGQGTTLTARISGRIAGLITVRWTSNNPAFADRKIPLIHQLMVEPHFRRKGIGTALLDAAELSAARRGRRAIGITVGLFDEYGPAQRLYAQRGYLPDGRGACRGREPLREGQVVLIDHSLIIWLTKDITQLLPATPRPGMLPADPHG